MYRFFIPFGQVYTLLEVRQLDGRTRLARLHANTHPSNTHAPPTPLGQVYTLLEVRQLDGRTRLARLHCPWPSGHWTGPWAQVGPESGVRRDVAEWGAG